MIQSQSWQQPFMMNIPFIKCWPSFLLVSRADLSYTKESSQIPSDFSHLSLNEYSSLEGNQQVEMPWIDSTCKSTKIMIESRFSERKHEAVKHLPGEGKSRNPRRSRMSWDRQSQHLLCARCSTASAVSSQLL